MATKRSWADRLAAAVKRGHFTVQDKAMAGDWTKCAVGEQPREITGVWLDELPEDFQLDEHGTSFCRHVARDEIGDAVNAYLAVRGRVRELKAAKKAA